MLPVFGQIVIWWRDPQWSEYDTGRVFGLAKVSDDARHAEVLAMHAHTPGQGDGSTFVDALMAAYETVTIWEVGSHVLDRMLRKRGFRDVRSDGGFGMRWERSA